METNPPTEQKQPTVTAQEPMPVVARPEPEKILLSWKAPARIYKKRNREYFTTIAVIVILVSVILFFAKEFLFIAVILSLAFVSYALAAVPPHEVEYVISNKGIRSGGQLYHWQWLRRFWFESKWKQEMLVVENLATFPGRLMLVLTPEVKKEELEKQVGAYLIKERPQFTFVEKAANWLSRKVPLDIDS